MLRDERAEHFLRVALLRILRKEAAVPELPAARTIIRLTQVRPCSMTTAMTSTSTSAPVSAYWRWLTLAREWIWSR